ncbi:MAG TPA: trypsin-like peptidase domain-containing protein [Gaiellaceae bacterium]|nr:trypsin-like peptidase domain-containing protein [Gaiellaceae bacterium]
MSLIPSRAARAAAVAVIAVVGGVAGAALYAGIGPGGTKTVVGDTTTVDQTQPIVDKTGLSVSEIYQRAYKGEVDIKLSTTSNFGGTDTAEGSGIVYDMNGDIVTNQHVIDGANSITVTFWNGQTFSAHVVGSDQSTDLAVIKVSAPKSMLHPIPLADSSTVQIGDGVVAIGSPYGLAGSVTSGIVSALHRSISAPNNYTIGDAIQTDAPINHGNSGGPLLNALGQVIGVDAQIESNSGASDGVGFAIPSNTVRTVVTQLIAGHTVQYAYLGVRIDTSAQVAGALLSSVLASTPAANAGLQQGDVITALAGTAITSGDDLSSVIAAHKPGDTIKVTFQRNGKTHTVQVKLTVRPA